jgi:glycosyltransferase involved in cell wall biosynthesis
MNEGGICVVIPAYNEGRAIREVLEQAKGSGLEILVVDDGSSDETAELAEATGVHLVRHGTNRGKGVAIRTAISWVLEHGFEAALFMDADGQHAPEEIGLFSRQWEETGADLILGSRMHDNSAMPWVRKVSNRFSSFLISVLAGTRVTDSQSGYRLLSARLLERLRNSGGAGFDFESEMIVDTVRAGLGYAEVPIRCIYGTETSHYHPVKDSAQFVGLVVRKACQLVAGRSNRA